MNYQIIGRNIEVTKAMEDSIKDKLANLEKFFIVKNVDCRVVVTNQKIGQKIEVTIPTKIAIMRAEVTNENLYNGIDEVVEKLERQLRKAKTKMYRKNKESFATVLAMDEIRELEAEDEKDVLVKTKVIDVETMDLDKAIGSMTMLGHDFYIYRDSENGHIAVVYQRKKGGYGLIEVENSN